MISFAHEGPARPAIARTALGCVAVANGAVAIPAVASPVGIYDNVPFGATWVSMLPPFSEHLISDVGGFYLAFTLLFGWAAITRMRTLVVPLGVAWTAAAVIHFVYHVAHLGGWGAGDAIAPTVSLALVVALPLIAIAAAPRTTASRPERSL